MMLTEKERIDFLYARPLGTGRKNVAVMSQLEQLLMISLPIKINYSKS